MLLRWPTILYENRGCVQPVRSVSIFCKLVLHVTLSFMTECSKSREKAQMLRHIIQFAQVILVKSQLHSMKKIFSLKTKQVKRKKLIKITLIEYRSKLKEAK